MKNYVVFGIVALFLISLLPLFDDPFYHREKVNFWVWAKREITELIEGEK